jgi:hypothetical protein
MDTMRYKRKESYTMSKKTIRSARLAGPDDAKFLAINELYKNVYETKLRSVGLDTSHKEWTHNDTLTEIIREAYKAAGLEEEEEKEEEGEEAAAVEEIKEAAAPVEEVKAVKKKAVKEELSEEELKRQQEEDDEWYRKNYVEKPI